MKIAEAMNTWAPALAILSSRGCTLRAEHDESEDITTWTAQIGSITLVASNPLALLGLLALWEAKGEEWSTQAEGRILYDRLLDGDVIAPSSPSSADARRDE